MATKSKSTPKSNVAKSSSLKSGNKFDVRIIALLAVLLVALVGYLFIRFSKASGPVVYDGANPRTEIAHGTAVKQANGETYVSSKALDAQSAPNQPEKYGLEVMEVMVYDKTAPAITACAIGTAPTGAKVSSLSQSTKTNSTSDGTTLAVNALPQGDFNICRTFKAEDMSNGNFRQLFIRFEAPVGQKVILKRIVVTPTNITVFNPSDFSVTQTGGYAPIKTLSDGRSAVYKKISVVQNENYGLVFSDKTTKAAGRYCYEYQISKAMNIAINYAVVDTTPTQKQVSSAIYNVDFPATSAGTYGTACTAHVGPVTSTNKPFRTVAVGDSSTPGAGELWITKAWFEEGAASTPTPKPATPTPVPTATSAPATPTPVVTQSPATQPSPAVSSQ